jgi:hypothetical protein
MKDKMRVIGSTRGAPGHDAFSQQHDLPASRQSHLCAASAGPVGAVAPAHDDSVSRPLTSIITTSELTCPNCGHVSRETMPTDACIYFYDCAGCGEMLKPKPGDCCVFCSYGSVPCPPIQANQSCCGTRAVDER